jgi:hypothetical protein
MVPFAGSGLPSRPKTEIDLGWRSSRIAQVYHALVRYIVALGRVNSEHCCVCHIILLMLRWRALVKGVHGRPLAAFNSSR